jgi:hypothetical protein
LKALSFDAYTLKWIAVIGMIANHVAIAFATVLPLPILLILYAVGGLTYVIMAYFVVEGFRHTSNLKKYIGRLFLFGLIAQAFHPTVLGVTEMMGLGIFLNIMFTIILGLLVLLMYDKIKVRVLFWLLFVVACVIAMFMDLFFVGVLVPLLYYAIKKESRRRTLPGVISGIIFAVFGLISASTPFVYLVTGEFAAEMHAVVEMTGMSIHLMLATPVFAIGCFLGAVLIRNYNGNRGKPAKWLFYTVYPLHLAVIAVIMVLTGIATFNLFGFIPL